MQSLFRLAAVALVSNFGARGAWALTAEHRWGEFAAGLFWWALMGAVMTAALVIGTRRVASPQRPRTPWRVYRPATSPTAGRRGVLSWTSTPRSPT